jgi:hypothetical protein
LYLGHYAEEGGSMRFRAVLAAVLIAGTFSACTGQLQDQNAALQAQVTDLQAQLQEATTTATSAQAKVVSLKATAAAQMKCVRELSWPTRQVPEIVRFVGGSNAQLVAPVLPFYAQSCDGVLPDGQLAGMKSGIVKSNRALHQIQQARFASFAVTPSGGHTARCNDGTYSDSQHASGTCSYHGGVDYWINHPAS